MASAIIIEETNLSVAWGKAFVEVFEANEIAPLVVVIKGLSNSEPPEIPAIRTKLDDALSKKANGLTCHTVANTIFPLTYWNPGRHRKCLYNRYLKALPRILTHRSNCYGVYFQRLISYGKSDTRAESVNQLEHIISTWKRGNHRRSALQASLMDPTEDHTHQRQRGFPCLQQVAFAPAKDGGLSVTGFYAKQYMFRRAYGNYLGLCRLGRFMAAEMGLTLSKVICIATPAARDGTKKSLRNLYDSVRKALTHSNE